MRNFEYRVETVRPKPFAPHKNHLAQRLNELTGDGWRVVEISTTDQLSFVPVPVDVLLEREVSDMDRFRRLFAPGA